jgi:hypothetical protein
MEDKLSTNYPTSIDNLSNPESTESMAGHAALHGNVNDAIEALESKLGVNGSSDVNSIDYKVTQLQADLATLDSENASELLGLDGNNDISATVCGIENPTTLDSFAKSTWSTVKYTIQITRGSEVYASDILVLSDGTDINVSESNIISNTDNNLFNYTFEDNSGIIDFRITPVTTAVEARYYRTAIKK